jgi:hypothetical protein
VEVFQEILKYLSLETFSLTIVVVRSQLENFASGREGKWLAAIRALNVSKDFQLNFELDWWHYISRLSLPSASYRDSFVDWKEKYPPVFKDLFMPDTLRKKANNQSLTAMEQYLESRPQE